MLNGSSICTPICIYWFLLLVSGGCGWCGGVVDGEWVVEHRYETAARH
jgi:hypothetical protein